MLLRSKLQPAADSRGTAVDRRMDRGELALRRGDEIGTFGPFAVPVGLGWLRSREPVACALGGEDMAGSPGGELVD
jgi:hypothetical protein